MATPLALAAFFIAPAAPASSASAPPNPCNKFGDTAPPLKHIVIVMMENRTVSDVMSDPTDAKYEDGTLYKDCPAPLSSWGATHWSQANYNAVAGGDYTTPQTLGCPSTTTKNKDGLCTTDGTSIFSQLDAASGGSWKVYAESMPSDCDLSDSPIPPGSDEPLYKAGHNPAIWYNDLGPSGDNTCKTHDVKVGDLTSSDSVFADDMDNGNLPDVSFVIPNTTDDGEADCSATPPPANPCNQLAIADTFLQNFMSVVVGSCSYSDTGCPSGKTGGNTLVLITYDEGSKDGDSSGNYGPGEQCWNISKDTGSPGQPSCSVPLFIVYPYADAAMTSSASFNHYSITAALDDYFHLSCLTTAHPNTNPLDGTNGLPSVSNPNC